MLYEWLGTTVNVPDELYFKMTDEELRDYLAMSHGFSTQNPFHDSVLEDGNIPMTIEDFDLPEEVEDIPTEFFEEPE